jgi:hypothetical protein
MAQDEPSLRSFRAAQGEPFLRQGKRDDVVSICGINTRRR